jgi:hypothetical protein
MTSVNIELFKSSLTDWSDVDVGDWCLVYSKKFGSLLEPRIGLVSQAPMRNGKQFVYVDGTWGSLEDLELVRVIPRIDIVEVD